ncbi:O-antigen ligase [Saccharicrinis carchari]|uniref:O-antigen ligase n=1 Tax=Saccharicrinis carchari TaxID=1168039 RepID=A0A521AKF5_SACCC|nr:O-antigen ligase family protein [Saccharicrinis carchari]SMO35288.1 O-antigen ligase [Saccharicrinis carchari]
MINYLIYEKKLFLTLLVWTIIGMASSTAALVIIPLHIFTFRQKQAHLLLLLGLWFLFLLSDSRQYFFGFAQTVKPVAMVVVAYLIWEERAYWPKNHFYHSFILFFVIAVYCVFNSPVQFTSLQKTFSYFLVLFVVPQLVDRLLLINKERFLRGLVTTGTLVLLIGLALRFVLPGMVIFKGERFSGLLGNPNGLGIFAFCFLMMYMLIHRFHRHYFTRAEHYIILGAIGLSLIFAGSRGGIFSSFLFLAGFILFQRNTLVGFVVMIAIFISYQLVVNNAIEIIASMGLEDYFRIDTLEKGSGRVVAFEFAWQHIQYNYWWGKGFGYTEHLMHQYADYFLNKGHQGNVHNSYLTIWLDTGLVGLVAFVWGWLKNFYRASLFTPVVWAVLFGIILSTTVESWLAASMNPFTIQLVIILSLLSNSAFYEREELGDRV